MACGDGGAAVAATGSGTGGSGGRGWEKGERATGERNGTVSAALRHGTVVGGRTVRGPVRPAGPVRLLLADSPPPRPAGDSQVLTRPDGSGARHTMSDSERDTGPDSLCSPERSTPPREPFTPEWLGGIRRRSGRPVAGGGVTRQESYGSGPRLVLLSREPSGGAPDRPAWGRPSGVDRGRRGGRPVRAGERGDAALDSGCAGRRRNRPPEPARRPCAARTRSGRWPSWWPAGRLGDGVPRPAAAPASAVHPLTSPFSLDRQPIPDVSDFSSARIGNPEAHA